MTNGVLKAYLTWVWLKNHHCYKELQSLQYFFLYTLLLIQLETELCETQETITMSEDETAYKEANY